MVSPTTILGLIVKGVGQLLSKLAGPLALIFVGRKLEESKNIKEAHEKAKEAAKVNDGVRRASDDDLDDILHS